METLLHNIDNWGDTYTSKRYLACIKLKKIKIAGLLIRSKFYVMQSN